MKVLVVGNGAVEKDREGTHLVCGHTAAFLAQLASCGLDVSYLEPETDRQQTLHTDFKIGQIPVAYTPIPIGTMARLGSVIGIAKLLWSADFAYIFFPGTLSRLVGIVARGIGLRYGLYVRGQFFEKTALDRLVLSGAEFACTVSPSMERTLLTRISSVHHVPPMFRLQEGDIFIRDTWPRDRGVYRILFVGRLEDRKGILEFVEIIERLNAAGLDCEGIAVGAGEHLDRLRDAQRAGTVTRRIRFTGFITDAAQLRKEYREADLFVFPSHDEGFPRVLFEAMAADLPIFTTFVGGIEGFMADQYNCMEIPGRNPCAAAEILHDALGMEATIRKIRDGARETISAVFAHERKSHYEVVAEHICEGGGTR